MRGQEERLSSSGRNHSETSAAGTSRPSPAREEGHGFMSAAVRATLDPTVVDPGVRGLVPAPMLGRERQRHEGMEKETPRRPTSSF